MNIFHKLLNILQADYRYCIACGRKQKYKLFCIYDAVAGICCECADEITATKAGSSFEAEEPVEYLLSPFEYSGSVIKILRDFKFKSNFKVGDILNLMINDFIGGYSHLSGFDCIIPVPLSKERLLERGYNQSEMLAKNISEQISVPMRTDIIERIRHTERQSLLNIPDRIKNVRGAFKANGNIKGKRIIIVDDIYTTGNTMKNCALELQRIGASEIIGITAAKSITKRKAVY